MAERSTLTQVIQAAVETTPGTAVTAGMKRFQTIGIEPSPSVTVDQFRPTGQKFQGLTALNKEWVQASISGRASYTELVYLLASVLTTPVIATPGGGTNSRTWTFTPDNDSPDTPKTFTIEHGDSVRADRFTYGLVTELGLSFNRNAIEVSGAMIGRQMEDGVTLTGTYTAITHKPVLATQVSVYLDETAAGLGGTKLTRVVSADLRISNRFTPLWVLDAANDSWVTHLETEPDVSLNLVVEADAAGMALLEDLRTNDRSFVRIEAVGDEIESGKSYTLRIDFSGEIKDTGGFSDQDGLYAIEWNMVAVYDSTWTKAIEVMVQNALTAL